MDEFPDSEESEQIPHDVDMEGSAENPFNNDSMSSGSGSLIVLHDLPNHSDSEDQRDEGPLRAFDTNIPTLHEYMGRLNSISGFSIFDHGEILNLVAMITRTIVLPGFTLPLVLDIHEEQEILSKCVEEKCVFALVFEREGRDIFSHGVLMEIFESFTKEGTVYLKARGRQRCSLVYGGEITYLGGRLVQIKVKALGEHDIKSPISNTQLLKLKALRPYRIEDYNSFNANRKYRQYHVAQFPYASWIYDRNEVLFHCKMIIEVLQKYHSKDYIPTDPVLLSYWFLQNYQLLQDERLQVLKQDSVLDRLKLEYKLLLMDRIICCRVCQQNLADHNDVFAMSKDGMQTTYCNPGGHIYETLTILQIRNFILVGMSSREFSWFPGYEWTITQCRTCRSHIGWRFASKCLEPPSFFGLARTSLDIKIIHSREELPMTT